MSARMREDNNGRGRVPVFVFTRASWEQGGRGWVPTCARTTTGGEGFPLTGFTGAGCEQGGRGWVPACARRQRVGMDSRLSFSWG